MSRPPPCPSSWSVHPRFRDSWPGKVISKPGQSPQVRRCFHEGLPKTQPGLSEAVPVWKPAPSRPQSHTGLPWRASPTRSPRQLPPPVKTPSPQWPRAGLDVLLHWPEESYPGAASPPGRLLVGCPSGRTLRGGGLGTGDWGLPQGQGQGQLPVALSTKWSYDSTKCLPHSPPFPGQT